MIFFSTKIENSSQEHQSIGKDSTEGHRDRMGRGAGRGPKCCSL